ncbi:hypothetical protein KY285_015715 [Solanum tuberosum]|nr:hypothetical protein KY285_015715 [Solanum tuberosum]
MEKSPAALVFKKWQHPERKQPLHLSKVKPEPVLSPPVPLSLHWPNTSFVSKNRSNTIRIHLT